MGLKASKELTYEELAALNLRLMRELEVAHEAMTTMYDRVQDRLRAMKEERKYRGSSPEEKERWAAREYEIQNLFDSYNEFPKKVQMLHTFIRKAKSDYRETAKQQWVRLEKFLSITNMDHIYRDLVTGDRIEHLDQWLDADKQEEHVFNETRLYEALGKDDARMVLALWRRFHEVLKLRQRIDHEDDESTPKIDPKDVMFRFRESELFGKMIHLLSWSKNILPKLVVNEKKADKHTEPQYQNLQKRLADLFDSLQRSGPLPKGHDK